RDDHHRPRPDAALDGDQELHPRRWRTASLARMDLRRGQWPCRDRRRAILPERRWGTDADEEKPEAAGLTLLQTGWTVMDINSLRPARRECVGRERRRIPAA